MSRISRKAAQAQRVEWITLLLALALVVLALSGCRNNRAEPTPTATTPPQSTAEQAAIDPGNDTVAGQADSPGANPASATPQPITGRVVLWHSWAGADGDALNEMLAETRQRYPDLTIDTLFVGYDDLAQSYADAVQAGGGPDLVLAPNWWLGDFVNADVVQPIDGQIADDLLQLYWPATLENLRGDGHLYGLPTNFELVSLYYNRALIAPDALPATTDDLLALAQQDPALGSGLYLSLYHLYWGIPAYGGQLLDGSGQVVLDQNNGTADFLTWLVNMHATVGNFVDLDYGMLIDRFKKGEFAFFVDGPWALEELSGALGEDLGVTLLPAGPAGPARPWLSADGIFFNPNNGPEQQRLALALAQQLTDAQSGTTLARVARRLPANRNASIVTDPLLQAFMNQADTAQSMPTVPEMNEVWGYGGDMLIKVLNGVAEPGETVVETTALINEANGK